MIVLDPNVARVAVVESEGYAPPRIHGHGPLPLSRSGQGVKPNGLEDAQRRERSRGVKRIEKHQCPIVIEPAKAAPAPVLEQAPGPTVVERPDHEMILGRLM